MRIVIDGPTVSEILEDGEFVAEVNPQELVDMRITNVEHDFSERVILSLDKEPGNPTEVKV